MSENLCNNLIIAGFTNITIAEEGDHVMIKSFKPNWDSGVNDSIKIKSKKRPNEWGQSSKEELMDPNDLIQDDDLLKPDLTDALSSCSTAKKACQNCSCGRAEREITGEAQRVRLTLSMIENPGLDSSCGSCGLGDAFRCAGCPYIGLPTFTPGQQIKLPDDFYQEAL